MQTHAVQRSNSFAFHLSVVILCTLGLMFDGFDVQAMGFIAPSIMGEWHIAKSVLGTILSANLFGMLIGAPILGSFADKIGRRPILIGALAASGILMLVSSYASSVNELIVLRFLTGITLGALLPTAISVASEFSPWKERSVIAIFITLGFVCGAAIGAAISAHLIPQFGWRSVFVFAGVGSIIAAGIQALWLPESRTPAEIKSEEGMKPLFKRSYIVVTLLLWVINFANLLDLYLLSSWLPTLLSQAHFDAKTSILAVTVLQSGGIPAVILFGLLSSRIRVTYIVFSTFLTGSLALIGIGLTIGASLPFLLTAIFIAGFCVVGGQGGVNALGVYYYPTQMRAAGMGWASGIGRFGSALGPLIAGFILEMELGTTAVFYFAASAAVLGLICIVVLKTIGRPAEQ